MTTGYSETADAMKLATPLMPKRPRVTGVRMPLLMGPSATYPEYNRSQSSKKKPRLGRTTNFHIVRVAGSWSSLAEIAHRDLKRLP
jgi:hypothetical protein